MFNLSSGYRSRILLLYVGDSVFDRSHDAKVVYIGIDQFRSTTWHGFKRAADSTSVG